MTVVRFCLVLVLCLCVDHNAGKPIFFDFLWCDFICDDDDVSTTTSSSDDNDWGCDCRPRRRRTTTLRPPVLQNFQNIPTINFTLPSSANSMNFVLRQNPNGGWEMGMSPAPSAINPVPANTQARQTTAAAEATTAAAATTPAGATTAPTTASG